MRKMQTGLLEPGHAAESRSAITAACPTRSATRARVGCRVAANTVARSCPSARTTWARSTYPAAAAGATAATKSIQSRTTIAGGTAHGGAGKMAAWAARAPTTTGAI